MRMSRPLCTVLALMCRPCHPDAQPSGSVATHWMCKRHHSRQTLCGRCVHGTVLLVCDMCPDARCWCGVPRVRLCWYVYMNVGTQNVGVSRCSRVWRSALTLGATLLLLFVSVILVFVAEENKRDSQRKFPPVDCASLNDPGNATKVVWDRMWRQLNLTVGGVGRIECFCKDLFFDRGPNALLNYAFEVPVFEAGEQVGFSQQMWCIDWLKAFTRIQILTYV